MGIEKLKEAFALENVAIALPANNEEIIFFEKKNRVLLPKDLETYFKNINGTNEEYDNRLFQFYSLTQFKSIDEGLKNWTGLPDYSGIVNVLKGSDRYFVFADYAFHMFSYAIHLSKDIENDENKILVICGDKYKKIANSFSEFIILYLNNSIELQLNEK
ncbi:MAG: hypothetical protein JWM14_2032 [Chitinophagaceae bacterium]|nr:hypothetical protein [Chitinophagaceae bacterium]